jgi:hypothetical protein
MIQIGRITSIGIGLSVAVPVRMLHRIQPLMKFWFAAGSDVTVELESSALTCTQTATFDVALPDLPFANFEIDYEPCSGLEASFVNLSPDTGPFSWDFGGGSGSTNNELSPSFTYPAFGTYDVVLTAGAGTDCADSQSLEITLFPEFPFDSIYTVQPLSQCDETGFVLLEHSGVWCG